MAMTSKRCTFGVEIECLVPWLYNDQLDPHRHVKGLPPVLRFRRGSIDEDGEDEVYFAIESLLHRYGIHVRASHIGAANKGIYSNWIIEDDSTVYEPFLSGYHWIPVELVSPVEFDIPVAYDAVTYVFSLITKRMRVLINPSCGLHVHVGLGPEIMPLGSFKRVAAICWAAESLLQTLHHPWRRVAYWCRPQRVMSRLSRRSDVQPGHIVWNGVSRSAADCVRYLATDVRHGELPISWREQHRSQDVISAFETTRQSGHYEPFRAPRPSDEPYSPTNPGNEVSSQGKAAQDAADANDTDNKPKITNAPVSGTSDGHFRSARKRNIPRIAFPHYTKEKLQQFRYNLTEYGAASPDNEYEQQGNDPGVWEGVRQIFGCQSSCEVAHLMHTGHRGSNVNFTHYSCAELLISGQKRTVEFRGAEGSTDPQWVATWARICVGLVKFAINAPESAFLDLLSHCAIAETEDGVYDCIDLLDELTLFAEAEIAEKRLKQHKEEWELEYVKEDKSG
ncbi:hypothetical protein F5B20DRAFT_233588 [Whalleya microplaca]|nr:hypothetical protein F5B20DRAFT_233588 [Whalleya microplaca]